MCIDIFKKYNDNNKQNWLFGFRNLTMIRNDEQTMSNMTY